VDRDIYQTQVLKAANIADYKRVIAGSDFLSIEDWTLADLRTLISAHLRPLGEQLPVTESCTLFGGGVLRIDGVAVLIPQCCSSIDDLFSWKQLLAPTFSTGYFCIEGHPAPKATKRGTELIIVCEDEEESFDQPAQAIIIVSVAKLAAAVAIAENGIQKLCDKIDRLSSEFGVAKLSKYMILGK